MTDDYNLEWKPIEEKKLFEFLIQENGFSEERVNSKLKKILQEKEKRPENFLTKLLSQKQYRLVKISTISV